MSDTPNTGIPYVPEDTTDPAAGLNLALNVIDALLQTAVINMDQTAPPGSPSDGDLHIVAGTATGDWAGQDNNLARYVAEGDFWQFYIAGTQVKLLLNFDDGGFYKWNGSAWVLAAGLGDAPSDGTGYVRKDGVWAAESGGGGSGDVVGPASSVDNTLPRFNSTTGKLLQGSGVQVTDANEISGYRGNVNLQTGTTYTLLAADSGKIVELANAAAITLTLPNNLPRGFCCTVVQGGAGVVTFDPASGATLQNRSGHTETAGEGAFTSIYVSANTGADAAWRLGGDTA